MEWLTENFWLAWLGIAIVLAAIEAATVDFVFIMFAGGALAGAVAAGARGVVPDPGRRGRRHGAAPAVDGAPIIKRQFLDGEVDHQIGASALVGRQARVLQAVTDSDGRIKLAGETWSARLAAGTSTTVGPGEEVRVIAIHGATAIVSPAPPVLPTDPTTPPPDPRSGAPRKADPCQTAFCRSSSCCSWRASSSSCSSARCASSRSRPRSSSSASAATRAPSSPACTCWCRSSTSCAPTSTCASRWCRSRRSP